MIAFLAKQDAPFRFEPLDRFPAQTDLLAWCQDMGVGTAMLLCLVGTIYLLWGWNMFKPLIILNAAAVGGYLGMVVVQQMNKSEHLLLGLFLGAVSSGALAWPMMKWAVAIVGGLCGAAVGAMAWLTAGHAPELAWAGALTGLVGFGLLSFILFRGSVIMYTSLQGAMMCVMGLLGLGLKYDDWAPTIARNVATRNLTLPVAVLILALLGLIYQQTTSSGGAAAGGGGGDAKKK